MKLLFTPLNRPVVDERKGIVTQGYGILVPNINVEISSVRSTGFASIMAGEGGLSSYCSHCCERYQDLFGEAIFSGKGLIDVDAFYKVLDDSLPEERILSHDILEGSFLRTGLASNVQIADGFPKKQSSYFDRLERWIRGDWQNAIFIFNNSPINRLSKFKLFDNLRRSITPVFAMLGILLDLLFPLNLAVIVSVVCLLATMAGDLFSVIRTLVSGGPSLFSRANYSGTTPGALAALVRCIIWVIMLAQTAWVNFWAICRAVWRSFVSKKGLLDWTTAAQTESSKKWHHTLARLLPTIISGLILLVFGGAWQKLLGSIILINVPFAFISSKEIEKNVKPISYKKREKLLSHASAMWQYFAEFCTQENNFLPPDNVQETPVYQIAQRTSPTNIGMMLLCFLAARDFGFIDSSELYERLNNSLNSIDKLEKWEGNLFNWYDTTNLKPLNPKYVSTVDSGNFLCSIVTLRQGLSEYTFECPELEKIRQRLTKHIEVCNLTPLYNKRRKLFHIGIDLSSDELSSSYYDLLMSEARMTGYFAIASRVIPKKHWGVLGRMIAKSGRHAGPVSWTGTMFEYFMPNIFLPAPKGTLYYEALKFCVQCQRNRVKGMKVKGKAVPWGISESGFYAFDRQLSYQYKAHGVQKLGLKRGLNSELVVSPYSTFLALSTDPDEAIKNLHLLEKLDIFGQFGFYEAIDYTHNRVSGENYAVVRSYMAHHLGMSMLSVLNVLGRNVIQKRFMADSQMACAACLLHEKIQHGASVYKDVETKEIPKTRERTEPEVKEFDKLTPTNPHIKLLSNREWSCGITDVGASVSLYRTASILRSSRDLFRRPQGVFAVVKAGKTVLPLVCALDYSSNAEFKAEFLGNEVKHYSKLDKISMSMQTSVHAHLPCEQRRFTVKNLNENEHMKGELIIYFEPSLATEAEEEAHFMFSKLFLTDEYDKNNSIRLYSRRSRNCKQSLCLALGFVEKTDYTFEANREKVLDCGWGLESLLKQDKKVFGSQRGNPDTCAAYCIPIRLAPKESKKITLLFYAGATKTEAVNGIVKMREVKGIKPNNMARGLFNGDGLDSVIANSVIPQLFYSTKDTIEAKDAITYNKRGTPALWSAGISGDYPIIYIEIFNSEDIVRAMPYVRINKTLRSIGVFTDIAIAYRDGGEYDAPIINAIREMLKKEACEHSLNVNGGVFSIDISKIENENLQAIKAAAMFIAPTTGERFEKPEPAYKPVKILPASPLLPPKKGDFYVKDCYFADGEFNIPKNEFNPTVPWSLVLCNKTFGTLVSDKALGFTWALNSRENKLTPWFNDTRTDNRGEMLILKINDK
ncbi:MAG TPA: glucoamylase family protein, partial [Clostridia bacterium]|nr:glucoamylase family protein [Clostridia bacterium]